MATERAAGTDGLGVAGTWVPMDRMSTTSPSGYARIYRCPKLGDG